MICSIPDRSGFAPNNERWMAVDDETYDGASDIGSQIVGRGSTEMAAVLDFIALKIEAHLEDSSYGYAGLMREAQIATCNHLSQMVRNLV